MCILQFIFLEHKLLVFEFIYGKLGLGRDILPLELCMEHAALYIPNLPAEINSMIGEYVYFCSTTDAIQQQNLHSLLEEFQQRKPKLFSFYLKTFFHRLKFPHYPTLRYGAFVIGIQILSKTYLSPPMTLSDYHRVREILQIRQVILYLCSYDRSGEIILQYIDKHLRDDKEVVLAAVKRNFNNYYFASSRLKADKDVLLVINPHLNEIYTQEQYEADKAWAEETFQEIVRGVSAYESSLSR